MDKMRRLPRPDLKFLFHGRLMEHNTRTLRLISRSLGPSYGARNMQKYKIYVYSYILNDKLSMDWNYSENQYRPETIREQADKLWEFLRSVLHAPVRP